MLSGIESRLTALLSDGLSARTHLAVQQAPAALEGLDQDASVLRVALGEVTPEPGFERASFRLVAGVSPTSQRVLPIRFGARLEFVARPAADSAQSLASARARLLDDLALTAHLLASDAIRTGAAFAGAAGDLGFLVHGFELSRASAAPIAQGGALGAELQGSGRAAIWPPELSRDEGTILAIDTTLLPPVIVRAERPRLAPGGSTTLHIPAWGAQRLVDGSGSRTPASLALRVLSDLPLDRRGTISSGTNGAELGLRIVPERAPETSVIYRAPSGDLAGTRQEYVLVHLARPDGNAGPLLGSVTIQLSEPA